MRSLGLNESASQVTELLRRFVADSDVNPRELNLADFKAWMKKNLHLTKDEVGNYAKVFSKLGGFTKVRDASFVAESTDEDQDKIQITALARDHRAAISVMASNSLFLKQFEEVLGRSFKGKLPKVAVPKTSSKTKRVLNVLLTDLHFGSKLSAAESLNDYGFTEESRRLAHVVKNIIQYKLDHRKETELVLNIAGDIIEGRLHDGAAGEDVAIQVADALYLLSQAIRVCAAHYGKVTVNCVGGNHDRDASRHPHGAVHGRIDSEATKIYAGLKIALSYCCPNVEVRIPSTPFIDYEVFGQPVYVTHGDNNLNPGNLNSTIDVKKLEVKMNSINISRVQRGLKPYAIFAVGHIHIGSMVHLPAGKLITNGALVPSGPYSMSIGRYGDACGQSMWESVPGYPVGDYRFVSVDKTHDADKNLDEIIKPFSGL